MSTNQKDKQPKFWKSLNVLNNDTQAIEKKKHEFMEGVTDDFNVNNLPSKQRRKFLAIMGATTALTATACSDYRDKGEIVSYNKKPEEVTFGKANYFASTFPVFPYECSVLVKTREGRPVKIDGNKEHPIDQGKINSIAQSSILNLYDPSRLQEPMEKAGKNYSSISWDDADKKVIDSLKMAVSGRKEIAIVTNSIISPSQVQLLEDFKTKYPGTKVYSYELYDNRARVNAWEACYGTKDLPVIHWHKAKVILAIDSDFLGSEGKVNENTRKFAKTRDVENLENFSRLYCVEAGLTPTGSNADYRFRLTPEAQLEFLMALGRSIIENAGSTIPVNSDFASKVSGYSLGTFAEKYGLNKNHLKLLVKDLIKNRGKSVIHAGDTMPEEVHIVANILNKMLGNHEVYCKRSRNLNHVPLSSDEDLEDLINNMNTGKVSVLINFDSNPEFHFPSDLKFEQAIKKVPMSVSIVEEHNETAESSKLILPSNHFLESWGDLYTRTGIITTQQPIIDPIYNTRQKENILLTWINDGKFNTDSYHKYIMNSWESNIFPKLNSPTSFMKVWYSALHDGYLKFKDDIEPLSELNYSSALARVSSGIKKSGYTLVLYSNHTIGDGRFANNGWLQELPHSVSKVTWDNYAAISPAGAKKLGVNIGDMIEISSNGTTMNLPVMVQPGVAEDVITTELGYGRYVVPPIGDEAGFNTAEFIKKNGGKIYTNVRVKKTSDKYQLVSTQEHHPLDDEFVKDFHKQRDIIQEGTVEEYKQHPEFLHEHKHEIVNIHPGHEYDDVKWGMAINLNKCTGCNQCVSACNVENNIAVVGKEEVSHGREMHWMRIDRYYSGTPEEPEISNQPMLCQHCDNAPCENVCPVVATTHSPDGLNQMTYNRCVGTRYCANNCPFKVRRFNFYDFRDNLKDGYYKQEPVQLTMNPEVTVRARGVMEKCTFCVQRIQEAKQHATEQGRNVNGSDVKTACQEACPADAIVFGDLNDPNSDVSKLRKHDLGYHVLEVLNVKPNVTYVARLRNTHSEEEA